MKRRDLFKAVSLIGGVAMLPMAARKNFLSSAHAAVSPRALANAQQIINGEIPFIKPDVMPQVINIFLYGGPSELGGNLTNMDEINELSQNRYPDRLVPGVNGSDVTKNKFWRNAGGDHMEDMLAAGNFSIYRTLHRIKDDSKAHRPSIFSNLTGQIGEDDSRPGIATVVASMLYAKGIITADTEFPFVSYEGDSIVFNQGNIDLPPTLKPLTLDENNENPYSRVTNLIRTDRFDASMDAQLLALANKAYSTTASNRFEKLKEAFGKRQKMEGFVKDVLAQTTTPFLDPNPPSGTTAQDISYQGNFGARLGKAVTLLLNKPDTLFVSLGSDGLGGWDDHDSSIDKYQRRLNDLMLALKTADKHIRRHQIDNPGFKNRIVINVMGDFGRNVNLNGSMGWDHGNNQNFYTVGGSDISGRVLGKIVGKTERIGEAKQNRQFTSPTSDSYQCEPFSVASTIYKYFGVTTPEVLTGEPPIDENAQNEKV